MGRFDMSNGELELYYGNFHEGAELLGKRVKFYEVQDVNQVDPQDRDVTLKPPVPMDIYFEERPSVKTLEYLGWFEEDPESLPYIAYLPFKDLFGNEVKIVRGTQIDLGYKIPAAKTGKFKIIDVKIGTTPYFATVKLAPVREFEPPKNQTPDVNNKWLNR